MASVKIAYASGTAFTLTLNSLASSSTLLAGRASTAVDNTTNLYEDYLISGEVKMGTTPTTATFVEVWAYAIRGDDTNYPLGITGTDANFSMPSLGSKAGGVVRLGAIQVDLTTTGQVFDFASASLAQAFGGSCPSKFGLFVVHNCGAALDASAGGTFWYKGIYDTVA
jgi:hypothetical protein